MSSACRIWSHKCKNSTTSRSTRLHQLSAPYSQQCLQLVSSLRTSTQCLRVFSKNTSLHASVPNGWRLPRNQAHWSQRRNSITATAVEMGRTALKAVINLVEISQCVDLPQLREHRVVEECMTLFNSNGTYRTTQKSKPIQKLSLQYWDLQEIIIGQRSTHVRHL